MTIRRFLAVAVIVAAAMNALALSAPNEAWGKSGVKWLFTDEEAAAWKDIKTDAEAQAFINLFWARRDPTPATPKNEFRETIEQRIAYADQHFTPARKKTPGSQTDRGMMWIVFGSPVRVARKHATQQLGDSAAAGRIGVGGNTTGQADPNAIRSAVSDRLNSYEQWVWEKDDQRIRNLFGVPTANFTFVDKTNTGEFVLERGGPVDVASRRKVVAASFITQPGLNKAPEFATVPMAGVAITPSATTVAPVMTALTTPALAAAITEVKAATANPFAGAAHVTWGEYITGPGDYFVPVSLYIPKSSPAAASKDVTFFGVIEDASGKPVLAFEEPAKLVASKDDFFVDKSITTPLPAGKYRGYFGLAANGKTVALAPADMQLSGTLDKSATAISPLILSNNVYILSEAQKPTDPFAFGGTKVVPKADKNFRAAVDELWYFFELRNPGISPEAGTPKVQVKVDITGKTKDGKDVKKSAPLSEAETMELKGVPGHFAIGNAFPLTTFKPGDYTINVKVIDTVTKASYTLTDNFRVVE